MITYSQLESMCKTYPNDQHLGAFVRSLYFSEERRATTNNPKGTTVTSLDSDMEKAHEIIEEEEETLRFPGNHTPHWRTGI